MFQFRLSETDLGPAAPSADFPQAGAVASFEGRVRNSNEGRAVNSLEYSAYPELAASEGNRIMAEAAAKFDIVAATAVHRVGHLAIGDLAVRIEVYAGHRRAAFEACSWILDEIKARLPIWKKEWYIEGDSEWVACHHTHDASHTHQHAEPGSKGAVSVSEHQYYDRQMRLENWGEAGQERLRRARVLLVGAGGLGCPAALYLAGAGVGKLGICDGDRVSADNLHRQVLYAVDDIGQSKAERAALRLRHLNPLIEIVALPFNIEESNADATLADWDLVIEGCDSFSTKFLVHDRCQALGKALVHASVYKHEIQLRAFPFGPDYAGPCLRCLYPQAPEDGCVGTCGEVGVGGPLTGIAGTFLASIGLNLILGTPTLEAGVGLYFDSRDFSSQKIKFSRAADCPLCSGAPKAQLARPMAMPARPMAMPARPMAMPARPRAQIVPTVDNQDLQKSWDQLQASEKELVVDIRESAELQADDYTLLRSLGAAEVIHWPLTRWRASPPQLPEGDTILIMCAHGVRSLNLTRQLVAAGDNRFVSITGGLAAVRALAGNQSSTI